MASTYLSRTPASATNRKTWTFSAWVKLASSFTSDRVIFGAGNDGDNQTFINFQDTQGILFSYELANVGYLINTSAVFRDVNGWYHIVLSVDTTQATDTNRVKLYVNGVQQTFNTVVNGFPPQNADTFVNNTSAHSIGYRSWVSSSYFDGSMAHVHFIDGIQYQASDFGETDAASGIWKPILSPSVTYGTNGFFLKFANSASLGTDSSGNANNFTVNGSGTQTLDTPSNVFATINALENSYSSFTLSEGNLKAVTANYSFIRSTIGVSTGKWYMEVKCTAQTGSSNKWQFGISDSPTTSSTNYIGANSYQYGWRGDGSTVFYNGTSASYGSSSMATGDIIGIALDLDNNKLYWSKNGTFINSANPATNTNGFSITGASSTNTGFYHFAFGELDGDTNFTFETNFGNGYFGTTAVATPESDSAGIGKFEYSVPSGYYALCTKNIATYG